MVLLRVSRSCWGRDKIINPETPEIKCVLGHYLSQVHGCSDEILRIQGHHGADIPIKWVLDVASVNDSEDGSDRELRLEELFAARGVRLEFT